MKDEDQNKAVSPKENDLHDQDALFREHMAIGARRSHDTSSSAFESSSQERPPEFVQEDDLFLKAMTHPGRNEVLPARLTPAGPTNTPKPFDGTTDSFFELVGSYPPPDSPPGPEPKYEGITRWRSTLRGKVRPDHTIDFHGKNSEEALRILQTHCSQNRRTEETLLAIVGRGNRSSHGPVLSRAFSEWLKEGQTSVVEWTFAPKHLGGAGAILIRLRKT